MATQPRTTQLRTKKISSISAVNPAIASPEALQEQIRTRAYELYEQRGMTDGHDLEDWLRAEAELLRRLPIAA